MIDLRDPEERNAAAGEYVLGTLAEDEHAAVRLALGSDAALRADVYAWQDRLLPLSALAGAAEPKASVWERIERSIVAPPDASARSVKAKPVLDAWWRRVRLWQGVSAAAIAMSLVLAVRLIAPPAVDNLRYVAVLQNPEDRSTGWVVELPERGNLRLVPVGATRAVPAGRSLQFWTKPEGAAGPTSLGLVQAGQAIDVPLSRLPAVGARQLFEITLEPENGSPIGRPTGPILYVGNAVPL